MIEEYDPDELDEEEDDDGYALPPFDPETHKLRIMAEKCSTCIFRPGNKMDLQPGRVKGMLEDVRRTDSFVTCHKTLGTGKPGAICAGSSEAHMGQVERIARRFDGVLLVTEEEVAE
jgi:hypothetical protein